MEGYKNKDNSDLATMDIDRFEDEDNSSVEDGDPSSDHDLTRFDKDGVSTSNPSSSETELAKAETLALRRSKIAVVSLLSATAILAAALAFFFARKAETNEFEQKVRSGLNS